MSPENTEVACPVCDYTNRSDANYCGNCRRPLFPLKASSEAEDRGAGDRDSLDASHAPLEVEEARAFDNPREGNFVSSIDAQLDTKPVSPKARLRKMFARWIWFLVLWSGSPILLLVVLVAAVARDNFSVAENQGLQTLPDGNSNVVSVTPADIADVPGLSLPLDIIFPFNGEEKTAEFETVGDGFDRPRGVAFASGSLYVVDSGRGAMFVLSGDWEQMTQVLHSNRRFVEPVDVAADALGNVYVLDAGDGGQVSIHNSEGEFTQVVPIPDRMAERSRGIDVDMQGRIWLAMTPSLAVAAFDTSGQELVRISTEFEGADLQPVDVAYQSDSSVYVSTAGMTAVLRFSVGGELLNLWPLVTANSVDGPHLSLDGEGNLYATQPEQGGILRISGENAEEMEAWVLPGGPPVRKLVGVTVDASGNVLVTDSENGNIYRVLLAP